MTEMRRRVPFPLALSLLLAACSGGGGGGGGGVSLPLNGPVVPFTAFSAIAPDTVVGFESPEIDDGLGGFLPSSVNYQAARDDITGVDGNGTLTDEVAGLNLYVDALTDPEQARLTVDLPVDPDLVTDFTAAPAAAGIDDDFVQFTNPGAVAPFADRLTLYLPDDPAAELEYMTFGAWALGMESPTANLGGAAFGRLTTDVEMAGVPVLNATYDGGLLGTFVEPGGDVSYYEADSQLGVDFFNGLVTIASTNTRDIDTGVPLGGLDIFNNGDAVINGNAFTGGSFGIVADGLNPTGEFGGAFYGPNAEEAGAWFEIDRPGIGRYFGSLGGKR
jgi:hypothetical protein